MLKTSSIGLPYIVEADNREHSLKAIYSQFSKTGTQIKTLIVNNIVEEIIPFNHRRLGSRVFLSKLHSNIALPYKYRSNKVKRHLPLITATIEIKNILVVTNCFAAESKPNKGISLDQFKKEIYTRDYDYVGLTFQGGATYCHYNLLELGFQPTVDTYLLGTPQVQRFTLYAKEEL